MANNPAMFVATTLVGNNLANYLSSLAIVLGAAAIWPAHQDLLGTDRTHRACRPSCFVYGELLPKNLFFQAPNRLLRLGAPLFLVFAVLFLPASLDSLAAGACAARFSSAKLRNNCSCRWPVRNCNVSSTKGTTWGSCGPSSADWPKA